VALLGAEAWMGGCGEVSGRWNQTGGQGWAWSPQSEIRTLSNQQLEIRELTNILFISENKSLFESITYYTFKIYLENEDQ
jgi:hypothetical protein